MQPSREKTPWSESGLWFSNGRTAMEFGNSIFGHRGITYVSQRTSLGRAAAVVRARVTHARTASRSPCHTAAPSAPSRAGMPIEGCV